MRFIGSGLRLELRGMRPNVKTETERPLNVLYEV